MDSWFQRKVVGSEPSLPALSFIWVVEAVLLKPRGTASQKRAKGHLLQMRDLQGQERHVVGTLAVLGNRYIGAWSMPGEE